MHLTVLGNPDNRRVALFTAAVRVAGLPAPDVVAWRDILAPPDRPACGPLRAGTWLRIESPGEDAEVDRLLRGAATPAAHGEIVGSGDWYAGLRRALGRVSAAAGHAGARMLNEPAEVLTMFDKSACHARLDRAGIPVPPALPGPVAGWASLRAAMREAGWTRVFVKPRHGSSASGVVALQVAGDRVHATTSVEVDGGRLFNSLLVRTYRDEATVAGIVDRLAPDGVHVERWFPKAAIGGRTIDLRVVTVAGRPGHAVVRGSTGPMTNLHLGGVRGDLGAVRAAAGDAVWARAMEVCAEVAACFPGSLHTGVDLMIGSDWRRLAVAEVNAFGDLLPRLLVDGRDTYAAEVRALASGSWSPPARVPAAEPGFAAESGFAAGVGFAAGRQFAGAGGRS